jgi:hypothetical protein
MKFNLETFRNYGFSIEFMRNFIYLNMVYYSEWRIGINLQYFTQFGHMAELSKSELVMQKHANSQAK